MRWMLHIGLSMGFLGMAMTVFSGENEKCPSGYFPDAEVRNVCLNRSLDESAVMPKAGTGHCHFSTHTQIPGTEWCIVKDDLSVSVLDSSTTFLIDESSGQNCRTGETYWSRHAVCMANNLALDLVGGVLTLKVPDTQCEEGRENTCNQDQPSQRSGLRCEPGFMMVGDKDMGVCMLNKIAYETRRGFDFGIEPASQTCPIHYAFANDGGWCLPAKTAILCGPNTFDCDATTGDIIRVVEGAGCCENYNTSSVIDLPGSDNNGVSHFAFEPTIVCGCPECGPPAGWENLMCEDERRHATDFTK